MAKILKAEAIEGAEKLLRLELEIGGETRQVFAGIKAAYAPENLVGRLTVMIANLAPRKCVLESLKVWCWQLAPAVKRFIYSIQMKVLRQGCG